MTTERRHGRFDPPAEPPVSTRLRVDPQWTPARLSGAIVRGVLPWVVPGSLLLIGYNTARMLLPVVIGGLVDGVVAPAAAGASLDSLAGTLARWALALTGLYLVINLGYRFGGRIGWFAVQRSQFELSLTILRRILDGRGTSGPARAPGGLLAVATGDVHRACLAIYVTVYPPGEAVGLLVAGGILLGLHPGLGLGVILALPVVLALMNLAARPLRRRSRTEQAGLADAAASAADLVAGYRVIRGLHAQHTAADRYRRVSRSALSATLTARSARAAFNGLSTATAQLFAAVVAVAAAALAFTGGLTPGQLVAVAGVAVSLVGPLDNLVGRLGTFWAISQASAQRVLDLLRTGPSPAGLGQSEPAETATPELRLDRLRLGADCMLDDVVGAELAVVDLPQPAHAALAGVLGAAALPEAGEVRYRGLPIDRWRPGALRERMLVVPHVPSLLAGTVLDNVRATGDQPVRAAVARSALAAAGLAAAELPRGYDTMVGDGGWELSGGQRQRIGLARAVAAEPELLVLLEPTTSVDAVTEQRIAAALKEQRAGLATLVVTSSPAFRAVADRVLAHTEEVAGG